jgi:NADPH:quinone reductase-like Zn-dependent oxidoreductase
MPQGMMLNRFGGPDAFKLTELPHRDVGPGQVRVEVKACGVNFADVMMRMGLYPEAPKLPFVPGYEFAGVVSEVGSDAGRFRKGDRVLGACRFGGYVTEIVSDESQLRATPAHLSDAEAASIPVNFMTAWVALVAMARVRKGDRVLIHSAAGGVGIAAVQLAANAGAEVTGLIGSEAKAPVIRSHGASGHLLKGDWEKLADAEAPKFDVILDPSGGASVKRSLARLKPAGRVIVYGVGNLVSGEKRSLFNVARAFLGTPIFTPFKFMMSNTGLYGVNMLKLIEGAIPGEPSLLDRGFDECMQGFEAKKLRALVGKTFALADAGNAHLYLQSGSSVGKVVLLP